MKHLHRLFVFGILFFFLAASAHAEVITIEGTIKSVDAAKRTITVETSDGAKTLDVSSKAKISNDGKDSTLDKLKAGQKVSLSYHDELEIVLKIEAIPSNPTDGEEIVLFNGTDLSGWHLLTHKAPIDPAKNTWIADSDRQVLASTGEDWNDLRTDEKFANFQLSLEWRLTPGRSVSGNGSGIIVRSNGFNSTASDPRGIEIDLGGGSKVSNGEVGITGIFIAYSMPIKNHSGETIGETGDFNPDPKRYPKRILTCLVKPKLKPASQWNKTEVACEGDRIKVKINGELVNEGWGVPEEAGHICLRNQNTSIEFRNIKLVKK